MANNTEFYSRILNGTYTSEDVEKFENLCADYSDMYKDIYGFRPRDERTMCVNGYSGNPNIEEFRNLLKEGFNPLDELDKEYDSFIEEENDWMEECEERDFMESNPSKEEILGNHLEYKNILHNGGGNMKVYTYLIKTNDDEFVETVRSEFASDADDFIAKKYPNANIECIDYEDVDW